MKKIDFNKLLKSVLLILAIILMFLKISARASADSMPSYASEPLDEWLFNHNFPSVFQSYLTSAKTECSFYVAYKVKESFYYLFLSPYENTFEPRTRTNNSWYPTGTTFNGTFDNTFGSQYLGSVVPTSNYSGNAYSFCWAFNGAAVQVYRYSITSKTGSSDYCNRTVYSIYNSQTVLYSGGSYSTASNSTYSELIVHGNMLVSCGGALTSVQTTIPLYEYFDIPVSKIILSSSLNDTQYALRIRLDDFASFSAAVSNQPSILVTVNVEGTEVSKTFTYESSYYHFNLAASSCYFDIPLSEFGIDQGTDYSFLTDIKLDMVISSPGGSSTYMYQDSYNFALVGSIPQAVISPTVVPMPTLTPAVVKSDQEIINIYNQLKQAGNNNGFNISFNDSITNYTFPEWVNQIEITIRQVYDAGGVSYKYQSAITSYSQYNQDINVVQSPSDYIFMNFASQFYDVCIINLDVYAYTGTIISGSDLPVLQSSQGSVILISDRYFNHQQAITSLDLLSAVQNLSFNSSLFFNFMNDKLSAFEGSVINGFNSLIGLDNVIIQRLDYGLFEIKDNIDSNTGKIVSAIENINFPSTGGSSYSLSALSEQLQLLFIPSLQWEQINYNDYLDSLGVLSLPFEFTFDVQSVVKSNYSSNMVLEINELNVPLGSDNLVLFSDMEQFNFNPKSIFPDQLWQIFQYLAAFALVAGEAWFTYCHIFRKEDKQ